MTPSNNPGMLSSRRFFFATFDRSLMAHRLLSAHPCRIRLSRSLVLGVVLCIASAAEAQSPSPNDVATADVLFKKGKAELEAGNYAEACATIEASQRLAPRPGTLFTLAECYAEANKPASALGRYDEFLRLVRELPEPQRKRYADRVSLAEETKVKLALDVSLLSITLPKNAPNDAKVLRDGTEMSASLLGVPLPVDPGEHSIVVEIPGRPRTEQKVKLALRERRSVELTLPLAPAASAPKPQGPSTRVALAYAALGVGAAGMLVGGITGAIALNDKLIADRECKAYLCNAEGAEAVLGGRVTATWSTVGSAVGGAGLAAGVLLWLTKPKAEATRISADFTFDASSMVLRAQGSF